VNILDSIFVAWGAISTNKLRSLLTMLGVIIGVAAVIALVAVGSGATAQVTSQIQSLGSNMITIFPTQGHRLVLADGPEILRRVPTIIRAVPSVTGSVTLKWQTEVVDTNLDGTTADYPVVRNHELAQGRFITEQDVASLARVAVVGQTVVENLFGGRPPVGQTITINGQPHRVIGVMAKKGATMGQDPDDVVLIPVSTAQRLLQRTNVNNYYLQVQDEQSASLAVAHLQAVFQQKFGRENAIRVFSQDQVLSTMNTMTRTLTMMLGAVAGISLVVGGIGIMNIMLVSVRERTREIGIRKAVGARRQDILVQFLVEALLLSVAGGAIGIIMGRLGALMISSMAGWTTIVSVEAVAIAFAFSFAVGLFFGVYPAVKAAALDPIECLRYE